MEIEESERELLELLKQGENRKVTERIQALYWLKSKQVESTGAIAEGK